jgi:regulatory protein
LIDLDEDPTNSEDGSEDDVERASDDYSASSSYNTSSRPDRAGGRSAKAGDPEEVSPVDVRELNNKLIQRFGDGPFIHTLIHSEIERLREERLQSDDRFAEAYLYSRARRLYGPLRIKAELRERGISDTVIAASLKASDIDWHANLRQLLETRFRAGPAADFKEKAKRLRFLQYRGFSADEIGEFNV